MTESKIKGHRKGEDRKGEELVSLIQSTVGEVRVSFLPKRG